MITETIKGHELEYIDDGHIYLVDGIIVPSITQILKVRFGNKYANVSDATLKQASEAGTRVHAAIEDYVQFGTMSDLEEVRGFAFLQKHYGFAVVASERPVILFDGDEPIAAGRFDLCLRMDGQMGGADIKRTATLDKDYLFYQLNLYRVAYRQSYGDEWTFLRGIHLRGEKRKFVEIPIGDAWEIVEEYRNAVK